ncbi:MAG: hypothetical protein P4L77_12990 [Sulfuriferula sp.]|nr:hypothetical protein [Sulfuriferula sp.]
MKMSEPRFSPKLILFFCLSIFLLSSGPVCAELKLSVHKFAETYSDEDVEENHLVNPHIGGDGVLYEQDLLQLAADYGAVTSIEDAKIGNTLNFRIDGEDYLLTSLSFMEAENDNDTCTPINGTYQCKEGKTYTNSCFLTLAEDNGPYPKLTGASDLYEVKIHDSVPIYCSDVAAVGVYDKDKNLFLVAVRYIHITDKTQSRKQEKNNKIGMSVLFQAQKTRDGMNLVQIDSCLGNPNHIGTISEARKMLAQCEIKKSATVMTAKPVGFWQRL